MFNQLISCATENRSTVTNTKKTPGVWTKREWTYYSDADSIISWVIPLSKGLKSSSITSSSSAFILMVVALYSRRPFVIFSSKSLSNSKIKKFYNWNLFYFQWTHPHHQVTFSPNLIQRQRCQVVESYTTIQREEGTSCRDTELDRKYSILTTPNIFSGFVNFIHRVRFAFTIILAKN